MVQVIQQKDQVTITTVGDQQVRRVRLNAAHPKTVTPTWSGNSVGHYEGDTLVIDTVGVKYGQNSMIDNYGTPYSEGLHVVERIRLVDAATANAAAARSEALNGRVEVIAGGASIDPRRARACASSSPSRTRNTSPRRGRRRSHIGPRSASSKSASARRACSTTTAAPTSRSRAPTSLTFNALSDQKSGLSSDGSFALSEK